MKQDAGWEKCDWDCNHGISAGREKLFGQEGSRMEIGEKVFCSRRRQAWRSRFNCNSAVYRCKCYEVSTKSSSKLQLSRADHAIRKHIEGNNGKKEWNEHSASVYKLKEQAAKQIHTQPPKEKKSQKNLSQTRRKAWEWMKNYLLLPVRNGGEKDQARRPVGGWSQYLENKYFLTMCPPGWINSTLQMNSINAEQPCEMIKCFVWGDTEIRAKRWPQDPWISGQTACELRTVS